MDPLPIYAARDVDTSTHPAEPVDDEDSQQATMRASTGPTESSED